MLYEIEFYPIVVCKVHIFWEGHKILRNLHLTFDCMYGSQKLDEDFAKFCGLLGMYELYLAKYLKLRSIWNCLSIICLKEERQDYWLKPRTFTFFGRKYANMEILTVPCTIIASYLTSSASFKVINFLIGYNLSLMIEHVAFECKKNIQ